MINVVRGKGKKNEGHLAEGLCVENRQPEAGAAEVKTLEERSGQED